MILSDLLELRDIKREILFFLQNLFNNFTKYNSLFFEKYNFSLLLNSEM